MEGPPPTPTSPQTTALAPGAFGGDGPGPALTATCELSLARLHAVSINREKLSEWHHKIRSKLFPLATGFFVRCRVEDATDGRAAYKVARVKLLKPDWSVELDLLTTDEIRLGRNLTNYDCISNAKITDLEYSTFVGKLSPEMATNVIETAARAEERLRIMETIILQEFAKKKDDVKKEPAAGAAAAAGGGAAVPDRYIFSQNVLLSDDSGELPVTVTLVDLLTQQGVGVKGVAEPDTPRMAQEGGPAAGGKKPKTFDEAVASNSTMIQLADVQQYALSSPVQALPDPTRVIDTIRRSANPSYTEFRYDNITEFARAALSTCNTAREIIAREPLFVHMQSPVTVFGDIHGNFADMMFFLGKIVAFDDLMLRYTTTNLLFLGDYVDRGSYSVECILYLLAMKCAAPGKVTLLRGNHESPEVNGDIEVYGYSSFKYQCLDRFGREKGLEIWIAINEVFQYLPVIADIDKKIFCVHGGLPQYSGGDDMRLEVLESASFPRIPVVQCGDPSNVAQRIIVNDLLWSDPALPGAPLDKFGFGPNPRGPDIKTFGPRAVDMFCERYGYQYIFRAHQEKADGVRLSDSSRVVTIFSTSDYAGHQNGAGCILVSQGKIRMAIKRPGRQLEHQVLRGTISPRTLTRGVAAFPTSPKRGGK